VTLPGGIPKYSEGEIEAGTLSKIHPAAFPSDAVARVLCLAHAGFGLFACLCTARAVQTWPARLCGACTAGSPPRCPLNCRVDGLRTAGLLELFLLSRFKDSAGKKKKEFLIVVLLWSFMIREVNHEEWGQIPLEMSGC